MKELLIATANPGKFKEICEALGALPLKVYSLKDLGIKGEDFVESGTTFAENAACKAKYFADKAGMMTLGEDSGILVDALKDELGVQTRRWGLGEAASDAEWLDYFMKKMSGVLDRRARFVSNAFLWWPDDAVEELFEGEMTGWIAEEILAPILPGLPLSSVFVPEGFYKAYAQLTTSEKNKISHRGKAINRVREFLL
jgi:XTP/dITP diphosphohydrolase